MIRFMKQKLLLSQEPSLLCSGVFVKILSKFYYFFIEISFRFVKVGGWNQKYIKLELKNLRDMTIEPSTNKLFLCIKILPLGLRENHI